MKEKQEWEREVKIKNSRMIEKYRLQGQQAMVACGDCACMKEVTKNVKNGQHEKKPFAMITTFGFGSVAWLKMPES